MKIVEVARGVLAASATKGRPCYLVAEPGAGGGGEGRRHSLGIRRVTRY